MKYLIFTFTIMCVFACSKNEVHINRFLDCIEIEENYQLYTGEEIDCQFHYVLTEYDNQQYIELFAHCADLTRAFVINENCVDICERLPSGTSLECSNYLSGREIIKTLLIKK